MNSWEIRLASEADADAIVNFNLQLAWESEKLHLEQRILRDGVLRVIRNPLLGRYYLAVLPGGEVIGQTMVNFEPTDWRNGVILWLQSVYVSQSFRRLGVFKSLYQYILSSCQKDIGDIRLVRLYMEKDNELGARTYQSLGMTKTHYVVYELTPHW